MHKKALGLAGIVAAVTLGFFREFVFVNINQYLRYLYYQHPDEDPTLLHSWFSFCLDLGYWKTYTLKWILTALFTFLFFAVNGWTVNSFFQHQRAWYWTKALYLVFLALSIIAFTGGWILGNINDGYLIARKFMGFLQSVWPTAFLFPVFYVISKSGK